MKNSVLILLIAFSVMYLIANTNAKPAKKIVDNSSSKLSRERPYKLQTFLDHLFKELSELEEKTKNEYEDKSEITSQEAFESEMIDGIER